MNCIDCQRISFIIFRNQKIVDGSKSDPMLRVFAAALNGEGGGEDVN